MLRIQVGGRGRSASTVFWRDLGHAIGALSAAIIADIFGMAWAIGAIAVLTFTSGTVVAVVMRERAQSVVFDPAKPAV